MTIAFHVTLNSNLPSILSHGLIPRIGERSAQLTSSGFALESVPRVYFFPTLEDCENAIYNWLGDDFPDDEALSVLTVSLDGLEIEMDCDYEIATRHQVPPSQILDIHDLDDPSFWRVPAE